VTDQQHKHDTWAQTREAIARIAGESLVAGFLIGAHALLDWIAHMTHLADTHPMKLLLGTLLWCGAITAGVVAIGEATVVCWKVLVFVIRKVSED
jgi:F0F1-type ATP synthase assembly protein I